MASQLIKKPELQEKFNVLVIDTVDEAFKLCEKWTCSQAGVEQVRDVAAFGGGYKILDDNFITPFRDLTYAGYGIVFISHETEKTYTDDKGQEYSKIIPALPNRPFNLINKMVDIIGYIREISTEIGDKIERKRYMFFRGDERFLCKSRFKYIAPKIELDYDAFVNAIHDAIDEEVAHSGGESSEDKNPYLVQDFDELMTEAKELWNKAVVNEKIEEAQRILAEVFGKPTKFSEIKPEDIDKLKETLILIKELF
jgi:hypothetical protein